MVDFGAPDNDTGFVTPEPSGPELVIGMITPLGVDAAELDTQLSAALARWRYHSRFIQLSELLERVQPEVSTPSPEYPEDRVLRLIKAGNRFCKDANDPAAVGQLGIRAITDPGASLRALAE